VKVVLEVDKSRACLVATMTGSLMLVVLLL